MKFRSIIAAALLALTAAHPALARTPHHSPSHRVQGTDNLFTEPDESSLVEHGRYTNKDGRSVHRPAHSRNGKAPSGATAKCRDGSYSFSRNHRGTCSRHGGVASWMN